MRATRSSSKNCALAAESGSERASSRCLKIHTKVNLNFPAKLILYWEDFPEQQTRFLKLESPNIRDPANPVCHQHLPSQQTRQRQDKSMQSIKFQWGAKFMTLTWQKKVDAGTDCVSSQSRGGRLHSARTRASLI